MSYCFVLPMKVQLPIIIIYITYQTNDNEEILFKHGKIA